MDNSKLEKLNKLIEIMKDDTVKPSDIQSFLVVVLDVIKKSKDNFESVSQETLNEVYKALEIINEKHSDILSQVDTKNNAITESFKQSIDEIRKLSEEIKNSKPLDGKDADEELIVDKVLERIEFPTYEMFSLEEKGEQIVNEINALPTDEDEYKIDASHIKNLPEVTNKIVGGVVGRNIYQMLDVKLTSLATSDLLQWNGTQWVNVPASSIGGVSSVSNSDGTLTISPTTGAVVASLNLSNPNIWNATQTFDTLKANTAQAVGSGGLAFKSNSGTDVALFGAGGGAGATFYGGITHQGTYINSYTSTASSPAGTFTGTWFTGGTATTTKPHLLIEPKGATSSGWSTNGTALGVNASSGFTGNLFDFQQNGVSTLKFSGATTSPLLTMTAASGSNNAKMWFTGQGNGTDLIIGSSNAASYPSHAYIIAASNRLTLSGGITGSGNINFASTSTLTFATTKNWRTSNGRVFFIPDENTGNAQARITFGPTQFSSTGTTEAFFTFNGAVNGVAGSTVALAGVRQSQTITPNAATPLIIGYQMANTMVASANNQTFVGIDLSSTFTPGAFTGLSAIRMRIGAGSTTTVPVQFTSGSLATTSIAGGMEFLTDRWYGTITTGTARKEFTMNDIPLTSGQMPFVASNGLLTSNSSMTTDGLGNLTALSFIKSGGLSTQFLKADGSVDSNTYTTLSDFSSTPSSTNNGINVSLSSQLLTATMSVTANPASFASAGIIDTSAQEFGGNKRFRGRLLTSAGTFTGTSSVTLGDDGNFFQMGSGTLDEINLTGWENGSEISLYFGSGGTITNNFTPTSGYGPFLILTGANKTVPVNGIVKFILLNGNWMEVAS